MLRVAVSPLVFRRSLASSVLLTRSWATETVADLRREAKSRGLSSKGTKALLIQRLEDFEARTLKDAPVPSMTRMASTAAPAATSSAPAYSMNIQIPDASYPEPELQAQVPYVPDFWGSREPSKVPGQPEGFVPKVVVIAGANTHYGGGPAHFTVDAVDPAPENQGSSETKTADFSATGTEGGLFFDIAQDLGLLTKVPQPRPNNTPFWQLLK